MLINIYQPVICKECELIRRYELVMEKVSMPADDGVWARDFAVHACRMHLVRQLSLRLNLWPGRHGRNLVGIGVLAAPGL